MAKESRKNSIVERPFPTGFGWTSAFVALYPNSESLSTQSARPVWNLKGRGIVTEQDSSPKLWRQRWLLLILVLLSPSMQAILVVSLPNSTAIKAAKAQRSARDFPDSLRDTSKLGEFPGWSFLVYIFSKYFTTFSKPLLFPSSKFSSRRL